MPLAARQVDITSLVVDAVVNAANAELRPGGGVCGAIHAAAGPELARACAAIRGGCPAGEARSTPGFGLPARHVIHAVGPVWRGGGEGEAALLAAAYRGSLAELRRLGGRSIAFPAISTGIYGFPKEQATRVAVRTVREDLAAHGDDAEVTFACFDAAMLALYEKELAT